MFVGLFKTGEVGAHERRRGEASLVRGELMGPTNLTCLKVVGQKERKRSFT